MKSSSMHNSRESGWVRLCDGRSGLRSGLPIAVSIPRFEPGNGAAAGPAAALDFVASDETLDRCDELICPAGWRLDWYRRNPVFQNAHQYGDILFTLGKALVTEVRVVAGRPALFQRVQFATEANPMARIAYALYQGKFLNAVSVGFIPLMWENGDGSMVARGAPSLPGADLSEMARAAAPSGLSPGSGKGAGTFRRRYLEQELLEVSAVGIPANPNALQLGFKAGAIDKADLRELLELLRTVCDPLQKESSAPVNSAGCSHGQGDSGEARPAARPLTDLPAGPGPAASLSSMAVPGTHARASGARNDGAQLLQLARVVAGILKS